MQILAFLATLGGLCLFFESGASADTVSEPLSAMEGDSVTLYNNVKINQQDRMIWIFGDDRIAVINNVSKICEDDECKERFIDRLIVDQTGSLTITDIRNTDAGLYQLKITSRKTEMIFNVTVQDVSDAERGEMKIKSVKEGDSVALRPGVMTNTNDSMRCYFNDRLIAEISGGLSNICKDDKCKDIFRDRLKLDNQTGSLTIMNTRNKDSGVYTLKIISSRFSIIRNHTVTVTRSSSDAVWVVVPVVVVVVVVVVLLTVAAVKRQAMKNCVRRKPKDQQRDDAENAPEQIATLMKKVANGIEAANETNATIQS